MIGSMESDRLPDSICEMSRTSLINWRRCWPADTMWLMLSALSGVSSSSCNSWPKPRMAVSGVRSSWLMRERNSSLAWVAARASSRAPSSSALRSDRRLDAVRTAAPRCPSSSPDSRSGSSGSSAPRWSALRAMRPIRRVAFRNMARATRMVATTTPRPM